jgi:hypothetical protein
MHGIAARAAMLKHDQEEYLGSAKLTSRKIRWSEIRNVGKSGIQVYKGVNSYTNVDLACRISDVTSNLWPSKVEPSFVYAQAAAGLQSGPIW